MAGPPLLGIRAQCTQEVLLQVLLSLDRLPMEQPDHCPPLWSFAEMVGWHKSGGVSSYASHA